MAEMTVKDGDKSQSPFKTLTVTYTSLVELFLQQFHTAKTPNTINTVFNHGGNHHACNHKWRKMVVFDFIRDSYPRWRFWQSFDEMTTTQGEKPVLV